MPHAAIYTRVSTSEQAADDKTSLVQQRAACLEKAAALGCDVGPNDVFEDDVSGGLYQRPALDRLKASLSDYQYIIVLNSSRLARDVEVYFRLLRDLGSKLRFVQGDFGLSARDPFKPMADSVQAGFNESEKAYLLERMGTNRERRASDRKLPTGKLPAGFRIARDGKGKSVGFIFDEGWRPFYAAFEKLYLAGTPYSRMPMELEALGFTAPGGRYSASRCRYIAANPFLRGDLSYRWTVSEKELSRRRDNPRPGVGDERISHEAAFESVWGNPAGMRAEFERRLTLRGRARHRRHRLTGILTCAGCGWRLAAHPRKYEAKGGGVTTHVYYVCSKHREFPRGNAPEDCPSPARVTERRALETIAEWVGEIYRFWYIRSRLDPDYRAKLHAMFEDEHSDEVNDNFERTMKGLKDAEDRLAKLQENLSRVSGPAAEVLLEALQRYSEDRVNLLRRKGELEAAIASVKTREVETDTWLERFAAPPEKVANQVGAMPALELQALLRWLFPDGLVVKGHRIVQPAPVTRVWRIITRMRADGKLDELDKAFRAEGKVRSRG